MNLRCVSVFITIQCILDVADCRQQFSPLNISRHIIYQCHNIPFLPIYFSGFGLRSRSFKPNNIERIKDRIQFTSVPNVNRHEGMTLNSLFDTFYRFVPMAVLVCCSIVDFLHNNTNAPHQTAHQRHTTASLW